MSYDFEVFLPESVDQEDVIGVVELVPGLDVDGSSAGPLTVVRGAGRQYCFTVEGPEEVEEEDLPEEVAEVALGMAQMVTVLVEGSTKSEIPHALRFARKLAREHRGVAFDAQTEEMWSRAPKRPTPPEPRVKKDYDERVLFEWYGLREALPEQEQQEAARRLLKEALPKGWLIFRSEPDSPLWNALLGGSDVVRRQDDERWLKVVQDRFVGFAEAMGAFFASAEVIRSGYPAFPHDGEHQVSPFSHRGMEGLPPYPLWWSWFGRDYLPLVEEHLTAGSTVATEGGVLYQLAQRPADRDQLAELMAARGHPARASWLPQELLITMGRNPHNDHARAPAALIPAGVRAPRRPDYIPPLIPDPLPQRSQRGRPWRRKSAR